MLSRNTNKEFSFFELFDKFINDSRRGKRLQPNGKRISTGTIANYEYTEKLLNRFCAEKQFHLRIKTIRKASQLTVTREKNYWKKFYKQFTSWLYDECECYDNYVGQVMKNIRVFFNYLNKDLVLGVGDFHKQFHVAKDEVPIFPLLPEELNFLIYNKDFTESLGKRMQEVKDFFVFGCTVALRVSDLFRLNRSNLRIMNGFTYLAVRSVKTNADTLIQLPPYAIEIMLRYSKQRKTLLPRFNKTNLNKYIKLLLEKAGFIYLVNKTRERRGKTVELKVKSGNGIKKQYRFCDAASTHTMRRTAITTMLSLGMQEQVVRRISGHSPASKEFYRYVLHAQAYQDQETRLIFEKLGEKKMPAA